MEWPHFSLHGLSPIDAKPEKHDNRESIFRLVTASLSLVSALLGFANRYSKIAITALCVLAVVLTAPLLSDWAKRLARRFRRRRFVAREQSKLAAMIRRFVPFISENRMGSIVYIVREIANKNTHEFEQIIGQNYAAAWILCLQQQISFPTHNIHLFMTRCEEFATLLSQVNRDYVVKVRRTVLGRQSVSDAHILDLERFREEFTPFLRSAEGQLRMQKVYQWGRNIEDWATAKKQALVVLKDCARRGKTIPYSDLAARITALGFEADGHDLHSFLGELSKETDTEGRGMISVLVVHKDGDKRPGPGFFALAKELGRDISDKDKCWCDEMALVLERANR